MLQQEQKQLSGLEAELNSSISDAIAETKIGTDTKINVVLVRDQNGANFFYKVNADGSMTPLAGGCGDPGSHFSMGHGCYTYKTGDPIYDDKGNITGYEEELKLNVVLIMRWQKFQWDL